jgi:hypothetical protein
MGEAFLFTDLPEAYWLPLRFSVQSATHFPMSSALKMAILTFAKRFGKSSVTSIQFKGNQMDAAYIMHERS